MSAEVLGKWSAMQAQRTYDVTLIEHDEERDVCPRTIRNGYDYSNVDLIISGEVGPLFGYLWRNTGKITGASIGFGEDILRISGNVFKVIDTFIEANYLTMAMTGARNKLESLAS